MAANRKADWSRSIAAGQSQLPAATLYSLGVADASLRAQLRSEIDKVRAKRTFGLVFESHLPERVRLPEHPVRRGTKVVRRAAKNGDTMRVTSVRRTQATVALPDGGTDTIPLDDLVVVAEFGEPVYPGLTRLGSINRGGDKPAHLVVNAENHHALEMPPLRRQRRPVPRRAQHLGNHGACHRTRPPHLRCLVPQPLAPHTCLTAHRLPRRQRQMGLTAGRLLVVSRRNDGTLGASIIDPHGDYLADARPKLQALARYAELHGEHYVRIESIVKVGTTLRVLDIHDLGVRAAVLEFDGAQVGSLYEGDLARDYR